MGPFVLARLRVDLIAAGMADSVTTLRFGLVAGNVHKSQASAITEFMDQQQWFYWSPDDIKLKVTALARRGYENDSAVITAKILMR